MIIDFVNFLNIQNRKKQTPGKRVRAAKSQSMKKSETQKILSNYSSKQNYRIENNKHITVYSRNNTSHSYNFDHIFSQLQGFSLWVVKNWKNARKWNIITNGFTQNSFKQMVIEVGKQLLCSRNQLVIQIPQNLNSQNPYCYIRNIKFLNELRQSLTSNRIANQVSFIINSNTKISFIVDAHGNQVNDILSQNYQESQAQSFGVVLLTSIQQLPTAKARSNFSQTVKTLDLSSLLKNQILDRIAKQSPKNNSNHQQRSWQFKKSSIKNNNSDALRHTHRFKTNSCKENINTFNSISKFNTKKEQKYSSSSKSQDDDSLNDTWIKQNKQVTKHNKKRSLKMSEFNTYDAQNMRLKIHIKQLQKQFELQAQTYKRKAKAKIDSLSKQNQQLRLANNNLNQKSIKLQSDCSSFKKQYEQLLVERQQYLISSQNLLDECHIRQISQCQRQIAKLSVQLRQMQVKMHDEVRKAAVEKDTQISLLKKKIELLQKEYASNMGQLQFKLRVLEDQNSNLNERNQFLSKKCQEYSIKVKQNVTSLCSNRIKHNYGGFNFK